MSFATAPQAPQPQRPDVAMLVAQLLQHADAITVRRRTRDREVTVYSIECSTKRRGLEGTELEVAIPTTALKRISSFDAHAEIIRNLVTTLHDHFGI